jgi:FkbM family methyltransferase
MKLILDIGGHLGFDSEFYLKKGFRVVTVEADPYIANELEQKLIQYRIDRKLIIVKKAISDHYGYVEFTKHKLHSDWGSVNPEWNQKYEDEVEQIKVPCITLSYLLSIYGSGYYMKVDIEGGDCMCIKQLKGFPLPKYLSVELLTPNNIITNNVNCLELISEIINLGYKKFQLVDQSKNHLTKCPNPAREGNFVDYEFNGYCSGLFGKELPEDKWVDIDKIILPYIHYFYGIKCCSDESLNPDGWYDLHCKIN